MVVLVATNAVWSFSVSGVLKKGKHTPSIMLVFPVREASKVKMAVVTTVVAIRAILLFDRVLAFSGNHTTRKRSIPTKTTYQEDEIFVPRYIKKNSLQPVTLSDLMSPLKRSINAPLTKGNIRRNARSESAKAVRYTPVDECWKRLLLITMIVKVFPSKPNTMSSGTMIYVVIVVQETEADPLRAGVTDVMLVVLTLLLFRNSSAITIMLVVA